MSKKIIYLKCFLFLIYSTSFSMNINGGSSQVKAKAGERITNLGVLSFVGDSGMIAIDGGVVENKKEISNKGYGGMEARGKSSSVINGITGVIKNEGREGIRTYGEGSISLNKGKILNNGDYGIVVYEKAGAINDSEGVIKNKGQMGMYANGEDAFLINRGEILNDGSYGMAAVGKSEAINDSEGHIKNNGDYGMYASDLGSSITNKGVIENTGNKKMVAKKGAIAINEGRVANIINDQIGIFLENSKGSKNLGEIDVTNGIGVKANHSNFYNSGTINAAGEKAIEMDDQNSILELGAGTNISGTIDGMDGEDTLVLSGTGDVNVGNQGVYNFEKLIVANGDITAKGIYNIGVSDNTGYKNSAFGSTTLYDLNDVAGANGNLLVDGTINIGVNYDNIGDNGTNKTGRIVAQSVTKTSNGHIVLVNGGSTTSGIVDEYLKGSNSGVGFRVKGVATVNGAQVVDPDLFETKGLMSEKPGWRSITIADRVDQNGSLLIDQKFYQVPVLSPNLVPQPSKTSVKVGRAKYPVPGQVPVLSPNLVPQPSKTSVKVGGAKYLVPSQVPVLSPNLVSSSNNKNSKLLVPRNRVDLDSMEKLNKIKNKLVLSNNVDINVGEDIFAVDYLGTKGKSRFIGSESYNYDYDVNTDGTAFTYMYRAGRDLSLGTAVSYEKNEVKYNGVRIGNVNVVAPSQNHTEIVDSYNTEIFGKYEKNNLNVVLDLGYGLSNHKAKTNFVSGIKDGEYNSHILKTDIQGSYTFDLENNLTDETKLVPTIGLEYVNVFEDSYRYKDSVELESTNGSGYIGTLGLQLKNRKDKISWNYGITYECDSKDTFHNKRKVSGYNLEMEKLNYSRNTLLFDLDLEYNISEEFLLRTGYEYEKNKNYRNNSINLGFTYKV